MNFQKTLTSQFTSDARRAPLEKDTIFFNGTIWEYSGSEWRDNNPAQRIFDSKDYHKDSYYQDSDT